MSDRPDRSNAATTSGVEAGEAPTAADLLPSEHGSEASSPSPRWNFRVLFLLCAVAVLLGGALRTWLPSSDPPYWGYVYCTDEGHYGYCAHNRLQHGKWFVNEAKYGFTTPLFSLIQYHVARLVPWFDELVGLRLVSMLSGTLSCVLMAFFLRCPLQRLFAVALLSLSFLATVHARMGIPEALLVCMLQATVLVAWRGYVTENGVVCFLAGVLSFACFTIKPTGVIAPALVLVAPWAHIRQNRGLWRAWLYCCAGVVAGLAGWLLIVVLPDSSSWHKIFQYFTAYGRASISFAPSRVLRSLVDLTLSPAMQMLPVSWPLSLCWCAFVYTPKLRHNKHNVLETLIFLWLAAGSVLLGVPSYQPARWQTLLVPPVICAALLYLWERPGRRLSLVSGALVLVTSVASSRVIWGKMLDTSRDIDPGYGPFGHALVLLSCVLAAIVGGFIAKRLGGARHVVIASAIVAGEMVLQMELHAKYTLPSYGSGRQWAAPTSDLRDLNAGSLEPIVVGGDLVQDLSLRSKIQAIPTFCVLPVVNDSTVRSFFLRQGLPPTHFALLDLNHRVWRAQAPRFMQSLTELNRYTLLVGGLGVRKLVLYRVCSDDWMFPSEPAVDAEGPPAPSARPFGGSAPDNQETDE